MQEHFFSLILNASNKHWFLQALLAPCLRQGPSWEALGQEQEIHVLIRRGLGDIETVLKRRFLMICTGSIKNNEIKKRYICRLKMHSRLKVTSFRAALAFQASLVWFVHCFHVCCCQLSRVEIQRYQFLQVFLQQKSYVFKWWNNIGVYGVLRPPFFGGDPS